LLETLQETAAAIVVKLAK